MRLDLFALAVGLGIITAIRFAIRLQINLEFTGIVVLLWGLMLLALLGAVIQWPTPAAVAAWWRRHAIEAGGVLVATLVGAGLRLYLLGGIPTIINGDEGLHGIWALDTGHAYGQLTTPFGAMDGLGILYLGAVHFIIDLFGQNAFALRLLPALAGILALPVNYLLARQLLGPRAAAITLVLLTVAHTHVHFSRTSAVLYIYTTLFLPLALFLLYRAFERRSPLLFVLCAITIGIHLNVYLDGWAWLVLQGLIIASWALIDRRIFHGNGFNLGLFAASLAIITAPMLIWAIEFPNEFGSRVAADGTIASGWLAAESQITGLSEAHILFNLLLAALGTFSFLPFHDFYGIQVPTLDRVSGYLWIPGAVLALALTWNRRIVMLNGWFWGGIVALGVLTVPVSAYHYRLLVVLPVVCMFAGLFVDWLLRRFEQFATLEPGYRRMLGIGTVTAIALTVAILNTNLYYVEFAGRCKYAGIGTRQAGLLGNYLAEHQEVSQAVILANEVGFQADTYPSLAYLSGRIPLSDIHEPLGAEPANMPTGIGHNTVIAIPPERQAEITQLQAWFPTAAVVPLSDCGNPIMTLVHIR
ncbi:MAG TPA: glycosyltransferase family 39 protein [Roseiflexaceae bacterium]|nr:glycosyltransferase family 39 protein [Roseiflexaceae bacterium]